MQKEEKIYNKLILIGNGFDLALGLKTSYNDFLFWLLKKETLRALEKFPSKVVAKGHTKYNEFFRQNEEILVYGFSSNKIFDILVNTGYHTIPKIINDLKDLKDLFTVLENLKISIKPKNSSLFKKILEISSVGWVDIESIYFDLLKECLKSSQKNTTSIDHLNEDLEAISEFLKEYLNQIEIEINPQDAYLFTKQFYSDIDKKDIILLEKKHNIIPNHFYFLNFNYTKSLNLIIKESGFDFSKTTENQIHSSAFSEKSIIFGFGDEMDEVYKEIEKLNDNRYLKFIKSFQYFKSTNYRNLLSYLNSDLFQVCIYGHSCGLSDRIMLNEIFEHQNCKSIKIYFYNEEDFTKKTMNISRHFNSNKLMREKIVDYDPKNIIPQLKKV